MAGLYRYSKNKAPSGTVVPNFMNTHDSIFHDLMLIIIGWSVNVWTILTSRYGKYNLSWSFDLLGSQLQVKRVLLIVHVLPVWYHCLQTSSEKDTEQEQTQREGKVKQLQDELEITDRQITALNPLLLLDTLRQRCEQWSLTTIIIFVFLSVVVRYVCWQLTQTIGILFKTFIRPSDNPIENFILGSYRIFSKHNISEVCSRTTHKTATCNCSRLVITPSPCAEKYRKLVAKKCEW